MRDQKSKNEKWETSNDPRQFCSYDDLFRRLLVAGGVALMKPFPILEPQSFPGCYTLDLYCDHFLEDPLDEIRRHRGPAQFIGETFASCAKKAKKRGWIIHYKTRTATCPKCAKELGMKK